MITWTRALALLLTLQLATPARAAAPLIDYVVQKGDTCEKVTRKLYGSDKHIDLLHANNKLGPKPHHLKPGMVVSRDLPHRDGYLLLAKGSVLTGDIIGQLVKLEQSEQQTLTLYIRQEEK